MALLVRTGPLRFVPTSRRRVHTRADFLSDVASQTATAAGLLGISLSTVYLLRDVGRFEQGELRAKQAISGDDSDDEAGFIFSVSTVLSLIPFLSWLVRLSAPACRAPTLCIDQRACQ